jgi:hypothetical protein
MNWSRLSFSFALYSFPLHALLGRCLLSLFRAPIFPLSGNWGRLRSSAAIHALLGRCLLSLFWVPIQLSRNWGWLRSSAAIHTLLGRWSLSSLALKARGTTNV